MHCIGLFVSDEGIAVVVVRIVGSLEYLYPSSWVYDQHSDSVSGHSSMVDHTSDVDAAPACVDGS